MEIFWCKEKGYAFIFVDMPNFIHFYNISTHSSTLAWKIPLMEELGAGYCPWGPKELGTTERFHFHFHFKDLIQGLSCMLRVYATEGRMLELPYPNLKAEWIPCLREEPNFSLPGMGGV